MSSGKNFVFGKEMTNRRNVIEFNPDTAANPHVLIDGASGSGKTRLIMELKKYLERQNKRIYLIDFQGDMGSEGEAYYEFNARCVDPDSAYTLSPFAFEMDVKNGGPKNHCEILLDVFKKALAPTWGPIQQSLIKHILLDLYRFKGILHEDDTTWARELPTIYDLKELMELIQDYVEFRAHRHFIPRLKKMQEAGKKYTFADEEKKEAMLSKLNEATADLNTAVKEFHEYLTEGKLEEWYHHLDHEHVNFDYYTSKDVYNVFKKLLPYLNEIVDNPIFQGRRPIEFNAQVMRFDLSGLTNANKPKHAIFFSELLLYHVFRQLKMRGEYHKYHDKSRGRKVSDYIIIDESKLVLPTGAERDNPYNIQNRIASEARKYGLGVIWAAQISESFTRDILQNSDTKVVLKVSGDQRKTIKKNFGVPNDEMVKHTDIFGVALIDTGGKGFKTTVLPWVDKQALGISPGEKPF